MKDYLSSSLSAVFINTVQLYSVQLAQYCVSYIIMIVLCVYTEVLAKKDATHCTVTHTHTHTTKETNIACDGVQK